jgi:hypothetical protein
MRERLRTNAQSICSGLKPDEKGVSMSELKLRSREGAREMGTSGRRRRPRNEGAKQSGAVVA